MTSLTRRWFRAQVRAGRARSGKRRHQRSAFQAAVNSLTNYQRCRWAQAGYPGLRSANADDLRQWMDANEIPRRDDQQVIPPSGASA